MAKEWRRYGRAYDWIISRFTCGAVGLNIDGISRLASINSHHWIPERDWFRRVYRRVLQPTANVDLFFIHAMGKQLYIRAGR